MPCFYVCPNISIGAYAPNPAVVISRVHTLYLFFTCIHGSMWLTELPEVCAYQMFGVWKSQNHPQQVYCQIRSCTLFSELHILSLKLYLTVIPESYCHQPICIFMPIFNKVHDYQWHLLSYNKIFHQNDILPSILATCSLVFLIVFWIGYT